MTVEWLKSWLKLRDGEGRRLFPLLLLMFLTLTNLLLLKSMANSIFLTQLGADRLPQAYIYVAFVAGISTLLFTSLSRRYALTSLIQITQAITAILALGLILILRHSEPVGWQTYLLYVWSNLYGVVTVSQVYLLAGELFGLREAKRFFVWVGIAAISGGIFGGYLTGLLATLFSKTTVIFTTIGIAVACILLCQVLRYYSHRPERIAKKQTLNERWTNFWYPFHYLKHSKYLHLVAGMVGLAVLIAKLIEFEYSSFALEQYPDVEDLAAFFGFWLSTISLFSLLIQLLVTEPIIRRFGVSSSLQALPMGLTVAMLLFLLFPALWAIILARAVDGSLKQSLQKSSFELLLLPLPTDEKKFSKTFVDIFVDSLATGLSGVLLIVFLRQAEWSAQVVTVVILILLLVWLFINSRLSRAYLDIFRRKLEITDPDAPLSTLEYYTDKSAAALAGILQDGQVNEIRRALRRINHIKPQEKLTEPLIWLLDHPHSAIRAEALLCLANYQVLEIMEKVKWMLDHDPSVVVRAEALFYLISLQPRKAATELTYLLEDDNQTLANIALLTLVGEISGNDLLWDRLQIRHRLSSLIELIHIMPAGNHRQELIYLASKAIQDGRIEKYYGQLIEWLEDAQYDVRRSIIQAFEDIKAPIFLPALWQQFSLKQLPPHRIMAAITSYKESDLLPFLEERMKQSDDPNRTYIPKILVNLPTPRVVQFLLKWLNTSEQQLRDLVLQALSTIQLQRPGLSIDPQKVQDMLFQETRLFKRMYGILHIQLEHFPEDSSDLRQARESLLQLLEKRLDDNISRIFQLLNLRYATSDYLQIYTNLRSTDQARRDNALEFLENLLDPSLKQMILSVAEEVVVNWPFLERQQPREEYSNQDEYTCFEELLKLKDPHLMMRLLFVIRHIAYNDYRPLVEPLVTGRHPVVGIEAAETLRVLDERLTTEEE